MKQLRPILILGRVFSREVSSDDQQVGNEAPAASFAIDGCDANSFRSHLSLGASVGECPNLFTQHVGHLVHHDTELHHNTLLRRNQLHPRVVDDSIVSIASRKVSPCRRILHENRSAA